MKQIIFDTDVLIDLLRGNKATLDQVLAVTDNSPLFCSVITIAEIYAGMYPKEKIATDKLLDSLVPISVTNFIARLAGSLRNESKHVELADCLIAASALNLNAVLVTKNARHYPMKKLNLQVIK